MADITLRDRNGEKVNYPGITSVKLNTMEGGTAEFVDSSTIPVSVENVPIALDFSGGENQTITAPEGTLVKSAIIEKPENLLAANIAEGVNIAGIIGTLAAGGGVVCARGSFTPTSTGKVTMHHNLGIPPDLFVFCKTENTAPSAKSLYRGFCFTDDIRTEFGASAACWVVGYTPSNTYSNLLYYTTSNANCYLSSITSETIDIGTSTWPVLADTSYFWFAIGGLT